MQAGLLTPNLIYLFFLIISRYLGLFLITPIFSSRIIPNRIKLMMSFFMGVITFLLMYRSANLAVPTKDLEVMLYIIKELSIGVFIGFIVYLVFTAVQLAGQFIDLRMGFRIGNVVNPMDGGSSPIIGQFLNIFSVLIFFSINGHHILITSLYKSFSILPIGKIAITNSLWKFIIRKSADMFILGFKIALPVMGTIFIVDIMLGFLARAVPQMNLFIIGLPLKILIGFILLLMSFEILIYFLSDIFNNSFKDVIEMLKLLSPG